MEVDTATNATKFAAESDRVRPAKALLRRAAAVARRRGLRKRLTPSTSSAAAAAALTTAEAKAKEEPLSSQRDDAAGSSSTSGVATSPRQALDPAGAAATGASGDVEVKLENTADFVHLKLLPPHAQGQHDDKSHSLFFANNNWYLFLLVIEERARPQR